MTGHSHFSEDPRCIDFRSILKIFFASPRPLLYYVALCFRSPI